MSATSNLDFKFKFVQDRRAKGWSAKKAQATQDALVLDGEPLSYDQIVDTTVRGKRLLITFGPNYPLPPKISKVLVDGNALALEIYKTQARVVEQHIDCLSSYRYVVRRKKQLTQNGQGEHFRAVRCPACQSSIDLSGMGPSPYIFCRYCESIFTPKNEVLTSGADYHICDQCGAFDRVRNYTEFYFYFFLVVYGYSYKERYLCDHCANKMFKKMFFANLLFVLGVIPALNVKLKSITGRDKKLKSLSKANTLAAAGKMQEASPIYQKLYQTYPDHPGLRFNEGMGYLRAKDGKQAAACFERALKACPNYLPVLRVVRQMQGK